MRCRVSSGQCLSLSRIVILTSMMSAAISLATITVIMILLTLQDVWTLLIEIIKHWILRQQWDLSITRGIISFLDNTSENPSPLLSLVLLFTILHFIFSLLLTVGIRLDKRELLLPWLVTHLIIILVKIIIFSFTTFITFFIDLLVSVVFPLITGIVLGVSLLLWRLVFAAYRNNLTSEEKNYDCDKSSLGYKLRASLAAVLHWM